MTKPTNHTEAPALLFRWRLSHGLSPCAEFSAASPVQVFTQGLWALGLLKLGSAPGPVPRSLALDVLTAPGHWTMLEMSLPPGVSAVSRRLRENCQRWWERACAAQARVVTDDDGDAD